MCPPCQYSCPIDLLTQTSNRSAVRALTDTHTHRDGTDSIPSTAYAGASDRSPMFDPPFKPYNFRTMMCRPHNMSFPGGSCATIKLADLHKKANSCYPPPPRFLTIYPPPPRQSLNDQPPLSNELLSHPTPPISVTGFCRLTHSFFHESQ